MMRLWPFSRPDTPAMVPLEQYERDTAELRAQVSSMLDSVLGVQDAERGWPYHLDQPHQYWMTFSPRRLPGKLYSVDSLRLWAKNWDPMRSVIEYLKAEAASIPIKFAAKEGVKRDVSSQVDLMRAFVANDGPLGFNTTRRTFEAKLNEDLLVIGAYAVWYQNTRGRICLGCDVIDAATIKPRVDSRGWPDESIPFEQWVIGVHVQNFTHGELRYDGMFPQTHSPYFDSPVEYAVSRVLAGVKLDEWNLSWLSESNVRTGDVIALPKEWTPDQIVQFTEFWNAQSLAQRQNTKFLPEGSQKIADHSRKDQDFEAFEVQTIRRLCGVFGIMPASIGYVGEQYKVTQGDSMDQSQRVGLGRVLAVRKEFYDDLCLRMGCPDIECVNAEDDTDQVAKETDIDTKACGGPYMTVDEVRARRGLPPMSPEQREELRPPPVDEEETDSDDGIERADGDIIGWFKKDGRNVPITEKSAINRAIKRIVALHAENGGSSWSLRDGDMGGKKFCVVSVYREYEQIVDGEEIEPAVMNSYVSAHRDILLKPDHVVGTWVEDGKSYLDISVLVPTREAAQKLCMLHGQLAYFDLETFETVYSGYDRDKEDK